MESAGDVIKRFRDAAELSQESVAASLRVSDGLVSQWETGRTHPRQAGAVKLDRLLKANGEILRALGYVDPAETESPNRLKSIETRVTRLAEHVEALSLTVQDLARRIDSGREGDGRPGRESP